MHMLMILLGLLTGSPETAIPVHLGTSESVSSARSIRNRAGKDWQFFLGAHGELVMPVKEADTIFGMIQTLPCTEENDKRVIWLPDIYKPLAEIRKDGTIVVIDALYTAIVVRTHRNEKIEKRIHIRADLLPDFPTRWPYVTNGCLMPAPPGSILSRSLEEGQSPPKKPEDCQGWLVLGWDGELISPVKGSQVPANALWMIDGDHNIGIDLVHGGFSSSGIYAHIGVGGKMTFGQDQSLTSPLSALKQEISIQNNDSVSTESFWPFFSSNNQGDVAPIPPGYSVLPTDVRPHDLSIIIEEDERVRIMRRKIRAY